MLASRSRAEYAGGYLFFGREDGLFAQAFDPATLTFSGEPRRITDGMGMGFGNMANYAFSVSPWHTRDVGRMDAGDAVDHRRSGGPVVRQVGGDQVERIGVAVSPDERWIATKCETPAKYCRCLAMRDERFCRLAFYVRRSHGPAPR